MDQLTSLIDHKLVVDALPEHTSSNREYLYASNGVFVRAVRPGLVAIVPVHWYDRAIPGLGAIAPIVQLTPRLPEFLLLQAWQRCYAACTESKELLCHFVYENSSWQLVVPDQVQGKTTCHPPDQPDSSYYSATIDLHSHQRYLAYFSDTDNADEVGFRLYIVLGQLHLPTPQIFTRVGIFGHYWIIPTAWVAEGADHFIDVAFENAPC